jgi:hypothetical protein
MYSGRTQLGVHWSGHAECRLWCLGKPMIVSESSGHYGHSLKIWTSSSIVCPAKTMAEDETLAPFLSVCVARLRSRLQRLSWKHELIPLKPWFRANNYDDLNFMDRSSEPLSRDIETLHDNPRNPQKSILGHAFWQFHTLYHGTFRIYSYVLLCIALCTLIVLSILYSGRQST